MEWQTAGWVVAGLILAKVWQVVSKVAPPLIAQMRLGKAPSLEGVDLSTASLLLYRGPDTSPQVREALGGLLRGLREDLGRDLSLLQVGPDDTLEGLSVADMLRAGWVRVEAVEADRRAILQAISGGAFDSEDEGERAKFETWAAAKVAGLPLSLGGDLDLSRRVVAAVQAGESSVSGIAKAVGLLADRASLAQVADTLEALQADGAVIYRRETGDWGSR